MAVTAVGRWPLGGRGQEGGRASGLLCLCALVRGPGADGHVCSAHRAAAAGQGSEAVRRWRGQRLAGWAGSSRGASTAGARPAQGGMGHSSHGNSTAWLSPKRQND